jgi:hypothetical protein
MEGVVKMMRGFMQTCHTYTTLPLRAVGSAQE